MAGQMISSYLVVALAGLATLDAALIRTSRAACPEVKTKADFDYRPVYVHLVHIQATTCL